MARICARTRHCLCTTTWIQAHFCTPFCGCPLKRLLQKHPEINEHCSLQLRRDPHRSSQTDGADEWKVS
eukprot:scaffold241046_cov16-Tisochrysis_lutea.AAC.3